MAAILTWKATLVIIIIVVAFGGCFLKIGFDCGYRTAKEEDRKKELRKKGIVK